MKLHHIALIASDREKTSAFYGALGFYVTADHVRPEKNDEMLLMTDGTVVLEVFVKRDAPKRPNYPEAYGLRHLALCPEDLDETVAKLREFGYVPEPIRKDSVTGKRLTFVADPDGLPIELHEE